MSIIKIFHNNTLLDSKIIKNSVSGFVEIFFNNKTISLKKNSDFLLFNDKLISFNNSKRLVNKFYAFTKFEFESYHFQNLSFFNKLYMIGLGYKNFLLDDKLYILIGDCNYIILEIPSGLNIICKKNQIYLMSNNLQMIFDFSTILKKIKKVNFYKGKGVMEFPNFKFTKLKVGKKQRFM